jgi:hypothetical protein
MMFDRLDHPPRSQISERIIQDRTHLVKRVLGPIAPREVLRNLLRPPHDLASDRILDLRVGCCSANWLVGCGPGLLVWCVDCTGPFATAALFDQARHDQTTTHGALINQTNTHLHDARPDGGQGQLLGRHGCYCCCCCCCCYCCCCCRCCCCVGAASTAWALRAALVVSGLKPSAGWCTPVFATNQSWTAAAAGLSADAATARKV